MKKKDYSYLKGKQVEVISPYGHKYECCYVAQIEDGVGLTILGTLVEWADDGEPTCAEDIAAIGTERKVCCLRDEIEEHRRLFPFAVEAIEKGIIDPLKIEKRAEVFVLGRSLFGGQPLCAFED